MQANWRQPTPQENKSLTGCPNCRCISQEKINVKRPAWKIRTTFAKPHFSLLAHKNVTCKETILLSAKTKIMAATLALKMLNFYLVSSSLYTFRVYSQVFIILFTEDTSLHLIKAKVTAESDSSEKLHCWWVLIQVGQTQLFGCSKCQMLLFLALIDQCLHDDRLHSGASLSLLLQS